MEESTTNDKTTPETWPELVKFTAAMQARLEEKSAERNGKSWKAWTPEQILEWLNDHLFHLEEAIYTDDNPMIRKKAADVANFAMMIFDVAAEAAEASAAEVRKCRVCGCTDARACEGGCCWVEDPEGGNLCSECAAD